MYNKIIVDGLRGLKHIEIDDFKKINLFVGNNNSGKTTILESIFLSINPGNAELPLKINKFREYDLIGENYWRTLFNKLDIKSKIEVRADLDNLKEKRRLIITPRSDIIDLHKASSMDEEKFNLKDSHSGASPSVNGLDLNFAITKNRKQKKYVAKVYSIGPQVKLDIPKEYQETLSGIYVRSEIDFGEIARIFSNLQIKKGIPRIIKVLKRIEPALENLSIGADGIIYCDIGLDRLLPINVMGGGILRILHIVLAISDKQGGVVLIDEIENGLHYSSQKILWEAIFESALEFDAQIFATTHSLECINAFSSSYANSKLSGTNDNIRLYRLERRADDTAVISYNDKILAASLDSGWEIR
jgi:AAA15 family ATPase/GTPase